MIETPKPNLVQKLCQIMAAVGRVPKRGYNSHHKYYYALESDLVEAVRTELSTRNVFIFPNTTSHVRNAGIDDIMVEWTFVNGDDLEDKYTCSIPGSGQDTGDKGVYKALTGSLKFFLTKAFLLPTSNEPEAEDTTGTGTPAPVLPQSEQVNHTPAQAGNDPKPNQPTMTEFVESLTPSDEQIAENIAAQAAMPAPDRPVTNEEKTAYSARLREYVNVFLPKAGIANPKDVLKAFTLSTVGKDKTTNLTYNEWETLLTKLDANRNDLPLLLAKPEAANVS